MARKTVAKIMRDAYPGDLAAAVAVTTRPDEPPRPPDLVTGSSTPELDRVWISDITYLHTAQGWLYLAVVRDGCSRRVLGWAIEDHKRAELVTEALAMAVATRGGRPTRCLPRRPRQPIHLREVTDFAAAHNLACSVGPPGSAGTTRWPNRSGRP